MKTHLIKQLNIMKISNTPKGNKYLIFTFFDDFSLAFGFFALNKERNIKLVIKCFILYLILGFLNTCFLS